MDLKELRGKRKLKDVAEALGWKYSSRLCNYESGARGADPEVLDSLAQVYGVPLKIVFDAYIETRKKAS
ncbi:MAG: helix-turn-helix transcriptional regulator [Candidatus Thermoplasmatota archaeon]|nr:helix-turn-helix transcriptional regulator [Candidatus Thermoplasmatota archaeon]